VWRSAALAIGAGLIGAAAFWWAAVTYFCADCVDTVCSWKGSCLLGVGIPLAAVLVAVSVAVPFRLVEGRWPWRAPGDGGRE
jgi:hypothetical protein